MNVILVGGGRVGAALAQKLSADAHDVTLIERNSRLAAELEGAADAQIVVGDATLPSTLQRAGIERAELLLAATESDATNVLVGTLAARVFSVPRVLVRARELEHAETFTRLVADIEGEHTCIGPERAAVDRILTLLDVPGALDVVAFLGGRLLVAGFRIRAGSDLLGLTLSHLNLMFPATPTLAVAIHRGDEWIIPHGAEEILDGDVIYFAIPAEKVDDVLSLVGDVASVRGRVIVAGATPMGRAVAKRLEERKRPVTLIEQDLERAKFAAEELSKTLVIHGRVTDQALLEEEEIDHAAAFVAVGPEHEENLVAVLLAKRLGAKRGFALVDNPALANLIGEVGIDAVISPRLLAVGLALQKIRHGRVLSVEALLEDKVEIIEVEAVAGSRLTQKPLAALGLPRHSLVAAVLHGDELLLPSGATQIHAGDLVLLVTRTRDASQFDPFLT